MPHIILEHAQSLDQIIQASSFTEGLIETVLQASDFKPQTIKYRTQSYKNYRGADPLFIHVTIWMLSGRSLDQKKALTEALGSYIVAQVTSQMTHDTSVSVTVNVQEMDRHTYFKHGL